MLYYFFRFLEKWDIPGSGMWSYISFRALLALILSLIISIWFGEYFIKWMKRHNATEAQRDKSIDPYGVEKKGVPTMGGVIILIATIVPCLLFGRLRNIYMILMLVTTVWLGAIGFADDYIKMKITKHGLRPIYKLIGQAALGLIVGLTLWASPDAVIRENVSQQRQGTEVVVYKSKPVKSAATTIPFVKNNNLNYSDLFTWLGKYRTAATWIFFVLLTTFVVMAVSNGSNLNDGMDGMCAGNSAIICIAHRICLILQYNVHTRVTRTCNLPLCIYGCSHRFPLVQCLSGSGIYGRYWFIGYRRYHRCYGNHHPQGVAHPYTLLRVLHGEYKRNDSGSSCEIW